MSHCLCPWVDVPPIRGLPLPLTLGGHLTPSCCPSAAVAAGQLGLTLPLSAQSLLASLPGLHFTEGQPPLDPEVLQQHVALLAEHFPGFDGLGADSAAAAAAAAAAVEEAPAVAPAGMGEASGQGQDALTRSRAEATKEKNRRAQQRFRAKQKSRLSVLEAEVARLRGMLLESGIDPGEGAAGPLQLVNPDGTSLAPTPAQPPAPEPAQSSQPEQPEQPGMPMVLPSLPVEAMFAQLEHWLELCPGLPPGDAVHYLQVSVYLPGRCCTYTACKSARFLGDH